MSRDVETLRELAKQCAAICAQDVQDERRALWARHNSLQRTRPMVLCRWFCATHEIIQPLLECEDPFYRGYEGALRRIIFQEYVDDDHICEPWVTVQARRVTPEEGLWGVPFRQIPSPERDGAWQIDPALKELDDLGKMRSPHHVIDEAATERNASRLHDAIGDIIEVNVDRGPAYRDIGNSLGRLRGMAQMMWDMYDNPEWLHKLLKFMSDGVLRTNDEAEAAGDWRLCNHASYSVPYAEELDPPRANSDPVKRGELWGSFNCQEYAQVSPAMHEEFMLQYQRPYMEKFALIHYGCCEDLTDKIDILRQVPNLRRIAVTPWADVGKCAERIGEDYVYSWQPNPAEMCCCGFDADRIRTLVKETLAITRGCHVDIVLKDVQTTQGHPERLRDWSRIVRELAEEV